MAGGMRFTPRTEGRARLLEGLGFGLLNLGLAIETASKGHTPVHGGYRSFDPDGPVGGTLRRSEHTVAYVDGREIGRHVDPGAAKAELPTYVPRRGAVVFVGTNSGYGFWVHHGTEKMPGRPFLEEGQADVRGREGELVAAGSRRHLGQGS